MNKRPWWKSVLIHGFLIVFTFLTVYPVLWVMKIALSPGQSFNIAGGLLPQEARSVQEVAVGRDGAPLSGATVTWSTAGTGLEAKELGSATTDDQGRAALPGQKSVDDRFRAEVRQGDQPVAGARLEWLAAPVDGQNEVLGTSITDGRGRGGVPASISRPVVSFENFAYLFNEVPFPQWIFNSIVVSAATTLLGVFLACTAAYSFSRFRFPGRNAGMLSFLVAQMFPGVLMMIPLYIIMDILGLLDMWLGLVFVYSTTAIPFCVWMLKGYFDTIPKDLEESALIDGASRAVIFWKIILPLARPAVAVTALFSFMTAWNEFILAATFMNKETSYTAPVGLQLMVGQFASEWGHFAAGAILVSLPVMALFFVLQKYLVSGLTAGAVKG